MKRGPIVKEHNEPISRKIAAEKAKWLMEEANKPAEVAAKEDQNISRNLATERAKWLMD